MIIFPAIDLYDKKAVRLYKGDYDQMTVYSNDPIEIAYEFERAGAGHVHLVDLEGAKDATTKNIDIVRQIATETSLFCEIGGGIRNMQTVDRYIEAGVDRVIIGTAAVTDRAFLLEAVRAYGDKIAVGADFRDGYIAIKGWLEQTEYTLDAFLSEMKDAGIKTVIITDISKDGAMQGTNLDLYKRLSEQYSLNITASGGVSSIEDIKKLREMNLYGAIIGRAYYIGKIDLSQAIEVAK